VTKDSMTRAPARMWLARHRPAAVLGPKAR
jgi:hypothetical protein